MRLLLDVLHKFLEISNFHNGKKLSVLLRGLIIFKRFANREPENTNFEPQIFLLLIRLKISHSFF
jgi:hypothetical protein